MLLCVRQTRTRFGRPLFRHSGMRGASGAKSISISQRLRRRHNTYHSQCPYADTWYWGHPGWWGYHYWGNEIDVRQYREAPSRSTYSMCAVTRRYGTVGQRRNSRRRISTVRRLLFGRRWQESSRNSLQNEPIYGCMRKEKMRWKVLNSTPAPIRPCSIESWNH